MNHNGHVAAAGVVALGMVAAGVAYRMMSPKLVVSSAKDEDLVPSAKFGLRNVVEGFGSIVQGLAKDVIGHEYPKYLPLLVFIFTWTWINNAIGLIPGFGSATDNMNTTLAMGLVAFVYYHFQGFRAHGIKYFQQLAGHLHGVMLILLGPAMFVIELISHAVRPVTLSIRLRTNIYADHAVFKAIAGAVNDLGKYLGEIWGPLGAAVGFLSSSLMPVPLIFLGLLVSTVQAFVFTLLTTVYVGMATAHEDDH